MNQELRCVRVREDKRPSSRGENNFTLLCLCFIQALKGLNDDACPHWQRQVSLLSPLNEVLISSRTPSKTHLEIMFYHQYGYPLAQSN